MGLEEDIKGIQSLTQESEFMQSEVNKRIFELREKILSGESTGDAINDFLIVNTLSLSEEYKKPFKETAEKLRGRAGNHVLVINQREKSLVHSALPMESYEAWMIGIEETLRLGVLTGDIEFDVGKGYVIFPTQNHVLKYDKHHGEWELQEGSIRINSYNFAHLGNDIGRKTGGRYSLKDLEESLRICCGDEVNKFFERDEISYVKALDLLGQEVPLEMREHYNNFIYNQKLNLINDLRQLVGTKRNLNRRVQSVYDSIGRGVHSDGVGITIVEDEDDAAFVSAGPIAELDNIKSQIRNHLRKAVKLGMHTDDLRLGQGPGIEMNVSEYISSMCKHYKVEIPK